MQAAPAAPQPATTATEPATTPTEPPGTATVQEEQEETVQAAPAAPQPATTATEPATTQPATTATEPATTQPATTATEPATTQPATTATEPATTPTEPPGTATVQEEQEETVQAAPAAPQPATTATEKRESAPSRTGKRVATSTRKRPAQSPEDPEYGRVQQEVWNSFIDSRVHSRQWDTQGVNLIPGLWPLLKGRVQRDRKSTGRPELTLGHYLDAALRTAPLDQGKLVGLADRLQAEQMGLPKGKKTTLSLSPAAIRNFSEILELLEAADYARKGKDVVSALVQQLLRDLEAEGPLPKPAPAPLV
ncbi:hypothetical protein ACGRHY_29040 [Streptomyces sp. HK10]|uniref:hypothetical protein n=1 Tax=Streptomyces sp. HK10 TaxID=3373255 RepID=UPI00374958F3